MSKVTIFHYSIVNGKHEQMATGNSMCFMSLVFHK